MMASNRPSPNTECFGNASIMWRPPENAPPLVQDRVLTHFCPFVPSVKGEIEMLLALFILLIRKRAFASRHHFIETVSHEAQRAVPSKYRTVALAMSAMTPREHDTSRSGGSRVLFTSQWLTRACCSVPRHLVSIKGHHRHQCR
ncbi:hypothetical protein J6590_069944 [Homalodisca vitripennis]|nr:hypothetical protein J6590_069944 [Homalodisca vitripennis]